MANSFLSVQEIARECLPILKENLIFPALCHRDYESVFSKRGDTVQVKKPPIYEAKDFTGSIEPQDICEDSVPVRLDCIADVSVTLGPKEMALNLESFTEQVLKPAVTAIAEKINRDGMKQFSNVSNEIGTAGTTPAHMSVFADAVLALNRSKAPFADRAAVWNPAAMSKLQLLDGVMSAEKSGSTKALREGSIGRILGMENYMSQAVPEHTGGDIQSFTLAAAAAKGAKTLSLSATSGSTFKAGDRLTIGGNRYTVTADAEKTGSSVSVSIAPGLLAAAAANAAGTNEGSYTSNMAFQKNAFAFVARPLEPARGAESYLVEYEGLPLRVTIGYDMSTKTQTMSVDTLYGFVTLYPELACRILG